jgi:hypothetical protein
MAGDDVVLPQLYFAMSHGVLVNKNGEYYQQGKSYGMDVKLFIVAKYLDHKERLNGMQPSITKVALECHVSKKFFVKIEHELMENPRILAPEEILIARGLLIGPVSWSMNDEDIFILYLLYWQDPTRSLKSYVYWLFCYTGMIVSSSLDHISKISPEQLKYGDEKSLKGKVIFNKLAQRDI